MRTKLSSQLLVGFGTSFSPRMYGKKFLNKSTCGRFKEMNNSTEEIIRVEVRKLLKENSPANIDEIPLYELGIDSLDFFEMLVCLQDEHDIDIPLNELDDSVTLKKIFSLLELK